MRSELQHLLETYLDLWSVPLVQLLDASYLALWADDSAR